MSLSVLFKTRFFASIKGEELNLCEWGAVVLLNNLDRSLPQAVSVDCRIPIPYHWVIFLSKKKPPVGFEPFVEVCLNARNVNEAKKYIVKCRDDKKITWYNRAG